MGRRCISVTKGHFADTRIRLPGELSALDWRFIMNAIHISDVVLRGVLGMYGEQSLSDLHEIDQGQSSHGDQTQALGSPFFLLCSPFLFASGVTLVVVLSFSI